MPCNYFLHGQRSFAHCTPLFFSIAKGSGLRVDIRLLGGGLAALATHFCVFLPPYYWQWIWTWETNRGWRHGGIARTGSRTQRHAWCCTGRDCLFRLRAHFVWFIFISNLHTFAVATKKIPDIAFEAAFPFLDFFPNRDWNAFKIAAGGSSASSCLCHLHNKNLQRGDSGGADATLSWIEVFVRISLGATAGGNL